MGWYGALQACRLPTRSPPRKKNRKKIEKKAKPAVKRKKAKNTIGKGKKRKKRKFDDADVALGLLMFTQGK